ncbi:hypothetical protein BH24CHL4_BH24CHL4_17160 [soil metagenome]
MIDLTTVSLVDQSESHLCVGDLLLGGALVVVFYRGDW